MPLIDLPCEIHLAIVDQLNAPPTRALVNLSESCSFYRTLLLPYIFKSITLRNKQIGWAARDVIVTSSIRSHVKEVNFIGSAPGNADVVYDRAYGEQYERVDDILPKTVRSILSDLRCFPNLQTLTIEFDYGFRNQEKWCYVPQLFDEPENPNQVVDAEELEVWRALMAKVWNALIQNKRPHFKNLEMRHIVPKEVSTFRTSEFGAFLNAMERFSLTAHGDVTGERDTVLAGVETFYESLDRLIFDHLNNVSHLQLTASEKGPLGMRRDAFDDCLPLPLRAGQMPLIQSVHLEGVWVCPGLLDTLSSHVGTLQSITMRDCMGHAPDEGSTPELRWAHLFHGLADSSPKHLRQFLVESTVSSIVEGKDDGEDCSDEEAERLSAVQNVFKTQPGRRHFAYQYCDETSGALLDDKQVNRTAFLRGDDQREYDRLMKVVEANSR